MKYNYLLEYIDTFSYQKKVKNLIEQEGFSNNQISEYELEETPLDHALIDLDTYSFLSEKKVILIRGVELLDIQKKETNHLFQYLENPDPNKLLIMSSKKLDGKKKITKELKKRATYLKLESNPATVIQEELNNYQLEPGVINTLLEYTNNNLDAIKTECEKLKQFKFLEKEIKKEDIKKICYKHLGDSTQIVFDLVRCISIKNKKEALTTYKKFQEYQIDDINIMGLLENQLRLLEQVDLLSKENKKKQQIADYLEIHPYRIEKTLELLRGISKKEIDELIFSLAELDYKIKSGIYESKNPLEMYILNL